ncbi:NAD(P)-binding protein [Hymenopellis radicata]|nr:NAD(P)-binding protein [Hymenopellis radicata]
MSNLGGLSTRRCILVTGATSGIGRALAIALSGSSQRRVVAAGRRLSRLEELKMTYGIDTVELDLTKEKEALKADVEGVVKAYPDLDAVILCAGVQFEVQLDKPRDLNADDLMKELYVNYTANVLAVNALLPHFQELGVCDWAPHVIVTVTSALAIAPAPWVPNYAATKAALHSYTISLRATFKGTTVHVAELIPPLVESELHDAAGTTAHLSKFWMPLDEFVKSAVPRLLEGDLAVPVGIAEGLYKRFEEGKIESADNAIKGRREGRR